MLTRFKIKNFKKLDDVDIELGKSVVLIGPNNSGKTAALQALALWDIGVKRWNEKREGKTSPEKRPGVTINRRDLNSIPTPKANLLWHDLHTRDVRRIAGKQKTDHVFIDIVVDGVTNDKEWTCGVEFYYSNDESFYCRPLRVSNGKSSERMPIPPEAGGVKVAFLPPMSGLAAVEPKLEPGRVNVLMGEGQTAQVLRNLCYQIFEESPDDKWKELIAEVEKLFGVILLPPKYIEARGEFTMSYKEPRSYKKSSGIELDLSSAGTGLLQTLLLLAYLYANPGAVFLLDEPDAHLEVLRQQQTYQLITEIAEKQGSQIVAASHSEVVLREAAGKDMVVAFVGKPHRIDDRGSQVLKALKEIGFDQYYQAEQTGWVLYLEGSTDLAILQAFAETLKHKASEYLERPFVHYVGNQPGAVKNHFWGLKEAKADLGGIAIFDRLERGIPDDLGTVGLQWKRRELENYLCTEEVLLAYARQDQPYDLFGQAEADHREIVMRETIEELSKALEALGKSSPWSPDIKVTDDFLDPLFKKYFEKLRLPNLIWKSGYHILARLVLKDRIDTEIVEKLDAIVEVANQARPRED
ncbi:MAG: AAA family ATPase [Candidatus Stahlbacteria bacterium]|nr:MAG: AAA family ATPase [Candidatus Stahlbacteria bacterium]